MIAPAAVVAQAHEWVGVRYLHQGRTRFGCDCLGFIAALMGELGEPRLLEWLPINYGREPQSLLIENVTAHTTPEVLQPAALILIQWPLTEFASHAAIYTGVSMIHAYESVGRVVEHGYREPWIARTAGVWALPGVAYE